MGWCLSSGLREQSAFSGPGAQTGVLLAAQDLSMSGLLGLETPCSSFYSPSQTWSPGLGSRVCLAAVYQVWHARGVRTRDLF